MIPITFFINLKLEENERLSAVSRTDEVYISCSVSIPVGSYKTKNGQIGKSWNTLRFLNSFKLSQSLDVLAKMLKKEDFALLKHYFIEICPSNDWTFLCENGFIPIGISIHLKSSIDPYHPRKRLA